MRSICHFFIFFSFINMDDLQLVKRFQSWDTAVFSELYEWYIDKIYTFIYHKTYNQQVAEDICQDVFMKAFDKLSKFKIDKKSSFQSWLYTIAYNKVIDTYRKQKDSSSLEDILEIWQQSDIHKIIDDKQKLKEVLAYINEMKSEHRDVIMMKVWEWLSYKQISDITGMSVVNCKKIFSRTSKKLAEHFALFIFLLMII